MESINSLKEIKDNLSWDKIKGNFPTFIKQDEKDFFLGKSPKQGYFFVGDSFENAKNFHISNATLSKNILSIGEFDNNFIKKVYEKNNENHKLLIISHKNFDNMEDKNLHIIQHDTEKKVRFNINDYTYLEIVSLFSVLEPDEEDPEEKITWHKKYIDFIMAFSRIVFEMGSKEKLTLSFLKSKLSFKFLKEILETDLVSIVAKNLTLKYLNSLYGYEEKNFIIAEEMHNYIAFKMLSSFQKFNEIFTDENNGDTLNDIVNTPSNYHFITYKKGKTALFLLQQINIFLERKKANNKDNTIDDKNTCIILNISHYNKVTNKIIDSIIYKNMAMWIFDNALDGVDKKNFQTLIFSPSIKIDECAQYMIEPSILKHISILPNEAVLIKIQDNIMPLING